MSKFCLSDYIIDDLRGCGQLGLRVEDVQKFIKRLKREIPKLKCEGYSDCCGDKDFLELIDKLAGDSLK